MVLEHVSQGQRSDTGRGTSSPFTKSNCGLGWKRGMKMVTMILRLQNAGGAGHMDAVVELIMIVL